MSDRPRQSLRPVPLAWRLVSHRKSRAAVAVLGIAFALMVIFVQLGFYGAVRKTAIAVTSRFNADLVVVSPGFVHLLDTGTFDRARLFQVLAAPGVESATPLYFRFVNWYDPITSNTCRLFALGFPLAQAKIVPPLMLDGLTDHLDALAPTGTILLDRLTQEKCGPASSAQIVNINGQISRAVGGFELGVGFLADGSVILSDDSFSRLFPYESFDKPHLGLVKLLPGADPSQVAEVLRQQIPEDIRILTRDELRVLQEQFWIKNTAVGNIFGLGSLAGFLVGLVVLFQILSTDIRNHLPLYATLRAMGYTKRQLSIYVLKQALIFAGMGYLPALAVTACLFPAVHWLTKLPLSMSVNLAIGVALLGAAMCTTSALLSMGRLRKADPAELF